MASRQLGLGYWVDEYDAAPTRSASAWHGARRMLRQTLRRLGKLVLAFVLTSLLMMTVVSALTGLYLTKRSLSIDLVPGVDMLPDAAIEGFLHELLS